MRQFTLTSLVAAALAALSLSSCNGDKLRQAQEENDALRGDLRETLATQDSLLVLVNDISEGMAQIKDMERIISSPSLNGESPTRKQQIRDDMILLQQALEERRQRLDEMEKALAKSKGENATLKKTIKTLKAQIAQQEEEITSLTTQLAQANIQIKTLGNTVANLNTKVDSLNNTVADTRADADRMAAEARAAETELNECFYAIGTKSELKDKKILQSGFLRKTKVMKGDFDQSYFTTADKRSLTSIPTHSRKAKIITSQPSDSYVITDQGDQKVIQITNPAKFWQLSNFLVIQVD